jgi:transcriptional regulator with XRE-family HTH domain
MDFLELERRFLDHLRFRVRSGELTERRIASLTGISQPHIHNVLRGKRSLSWETADVILHVLHIDLRDLLDPEERQPL